jgi:hypothetical protein
MRISRASHHRNIPKCQSGADQADSRALSRLLASQQSGDPAENQRAQPKTGPVRSDHADVEFLRQRLTAKDMPFKSCARRAMEIEDWRAVRCTMLVIAEETAIG